MVIWLVVSTHLSEEWWSSSVGMMKFPIWWENNSIIHVPNHQPVSFWNILKLLKESGHAATSCDNCLKKSRVTRWYPRPRSHEGIQRVQISEWSSRAALAWGENSGHWWSLWKWIASTRMSTPSTYMLSKEVLEVKLSTIWTDEKQSRAEAERRERLEERRSEKRKSQKKEDADARKGRKVAQHCVFPMIWGSGGSKSRLAKAAGAEPVVARSTFASQNVENTSAPDHFWKLRCRKSARRCGAKHISKSKCTKPLSSGPFWGSWDVEKVHAVVARSTFRSENVQNTPCTGHFWRFRCRKSARRCGAKHISK